LKNNFKLRFSTIISGSNNRSREGFHMGNHFEWMPDKVSHLLFSIYHWPSVHYTNGDASMQHRLSGQTVCINHYLPLK
jgi:hypothetical protein